MLAVRPILGLLAAAALAAGCAVIPYGYVYTVQPGDTLHSIAERHRLNYLQIADANDLKPPYTIKVGQPLRLYNNYAPVEDRNIEDVVRVANAGVRVAPDHQRQADLPPRMAQPAPPVRADGWRWPVVGVIQHSFGDKTHNKPGILIKADPGSAVHAAHDGIVAYAGHGIRRYGGLVILRHGTNTLSVYAYNNDLLVKEGDSVKAGAAIAHLGDRGLHMEIRVNGKPVDPMTRLPPR